MKEKLAVSMDRRALRSGLETIGVKHVQRHLTRAVTVVSLTIPFTLSLPRPTKKKQPAGPRTCQLLLYRTRFILP